VGGSSLLALEVDNDNVTCQTISNPAKARQELLKMLLSIMAVCGTKVEWRDSIKERKT
jgi:hypothetical protein